MLQLLLIVAVIVAVSVILLGINIFIFGKKFPETEVGKNSHMIKLGLRCPHCEERARYKRFRPVRIDVRSLKPDWSQISD